jgi:hypothetical protein
LLLLANLAKAIFVSSYNIITENIIRNEQKK